MTATPDDTSQTNAPAGIVVSDALLASLVAHVRTDCVILQEQHYIEDGWFIKVIPSQVQLWEIPQFGGEEHLIATFPSITKAYQHAISLG